MAIFRELGDMRLIVIFSAKGSSRPKVQDFLTIKEEFRIGEGCSIPGFSYRFTDPESHGS